MSINKSRQIVNHKVKWDKIITEAKQLLERVENRAARLKGAIKTFEELREKGHEFSGPHSAEDV